MIYCFYPLLFSVSSCCIDKLKAVNYACVHKMSDVTNDKAEGDISLPSEYRDIKHPDRSQAHYIETYQAVRQSQFKQARKYLKRLQVLMESSENVTGVQCELSNFIKLYDEARHVHESFLNLPQN